MGNKHRLPTKREKFDESYKKFIISTQAALDEATAAGDDERADKINALKNKISADFKEMRPLIQKEPGDTEPKQKLFL